MSSRPRPQICPCGSLTAFASCCEPIHQGRLAAASAEQLMRARYSAFAVGNGDFLSWSWHPTKRPLHLQLSDDQVWLGLNVLAATEGGADDQSGVVEFVAHYRIGEHVGTVHERSRFARLDTRWVYVDAGG